MEIIQVDNLSFRYPEENEPSLDGISFSVKEGEFVVLCGASGCGKTTLLRHLKKETAPVGHRTGGVAYKGSPLEEWPAETAAEQIGIVFQNPENQIVMDQVWQELAFSMENMGYSQALMRKRLAEMVHFFGLEPLLYKSVHELSGGQKQMINLASVLLLQPKLLLLDEPTSQLDPVSSREFLQLVHRLNQELSITVVMSEHRLEDVFPLADKVIMLDNGKMSCEGPPRELCRQIGQKEEDGERVYLPSAARLYLASGGEEEAAGEERQVSVPPLTVREGKSWVESRLTEQMLLAAGAAEPQTLADDSPDAAGSALLTCSEATFRYEKNGPEIVRKCNLQVYDNEFLAIVGGNGAGKSTLLLLLAGLLTPQRGKVSRERQRTTGYLAQNPLLLFSHDTVDEELKHMASFAQVPDAEGAITELLQTLGLERLRERHPHDLSGGEQQKLALALVLLQNPDILLIDEPTKGLDPQAKQRMALLLRLLRDGGRTIVMVTHDIEFAARHATRCAMLFDGSVAAAAAPAELFGSNYFYTTAVNRIVRDWLPNALTEEDVMRQWNGPLFGSR
jgi:energy-coupling factor transporter ATP-binding protein EcfA2